LESLAKESAGEGWRAGSLRFHDASRQEGTIMSDINEAIRQAIVTIVHLEEKVEACDLPQVPPTIDALDAMIEVLTKLLKFYPSAEWIN
jgi:hypothetical protein